jgi:alpha-methylacyl-CoA racemase
MTGWGQEGPLAHSAGHDINYIAIAGALHPIGRAGGPPQVPLNLIGDFGGGALYLVVGILAALREADRTGRGQVVDAAIVDGTAHLTTMISGLLAGGRWTGTRGANLLDTGAPFYDVYETADGGHMSVGALEPQFFAELVRLLGLADDAGLPAQYEIDRWPEMRRRFAAVFASRSRDEWTKVFAGTDACVAPVLSVLEAPHDPHLVARGTYEERDGVVQPAPAPRFTGGAAVASPGGPPPRPGEHTRAALEAWGVPGVDEWLDTGAAIQTAADTQTQG